MSPSSPLNRQSLDRAFFTKSFLGKSVGYPLPAVGPSVVFDQPRRAYFMSYAMSVQLGTKGTRAVPESPPRAHTAQDAPADRALCLSDKFNPAQNASLLHTSFIAIGELGVLGHHGRPVDGRREGEESQGGSSMLAPWVVDEVKTVKLNDKRLNERFGEVLSQLAARPTASIPAACGGRAEMVAAYRFCENEKTSFDAVLQPHRDATRQRMATQPVVILAQDTTEIDTTRPDQQVMGAGPLDGGSRRGALLHAVHAFTPDGTPLGSVHATAWAREAEPVDVRLSRAQQVARPIEAKESHRWVATLQQAFEEARYCPTTQFICVADSEADIYELLVGERHSQAVATGLWRLSGSRHAREKWRKRRGKPRPPAHAWPARVVGKYDPRPRAKKSQSGVQYPRARSTA